MRILFLLLLLAPTFAAAEEQSGKDLYMVCLACHGADGKGAPGAAFPPLFRSDWVSGPPERMISVILKGLNGPISVSGKPYNLLMPPQGYLTDQQIATIATYVRSNFDNKFDPVTPEQVATVRNATKDRVAPWTGPELLKIHPLPPSRWRIHDLSAKVYEGTWQTLPDFSKLNPVSEEKEPAPISLTHAADRKDNFAIVWEGRLQSPGDFDNNFWLSAKGEARLIFNGQLVTHIKGQSKTFRHTSARTKAHKGWNDIRLEYLQKGPDAGVILARSGGPMGEHALSESIRDITAKDYPDIFIGPENGKTALYRNTIAGVSPRSIGVGLASQIDQNGDLENTVNYAFSASTLATELIWTGKFMNAGRHWTVRGTGAEPPAGENIITLARGPSVARLNEPSDPWPNKFQPELSPRFISYHLGHQNRPDFKYDIGGLRFVDRAAGSGSILRRTIFLVAEEPSDAENLYLCLARDHNISADPNPRFKDTLFHLGDTLTIEVSAHVPPIIQGRSLLYPLSGKNLEYGVIELTYTWLKK